MASHVDGGATVGDVEEDAGLASGSTDGVVGAGVGDLGRMPGIRAIRGQGSSSSRGIAQTPAPPGQERGQVRVVTTMSTSGPWTVTADHLVEVNECTSVDTKQRRHLHLGLQLRQVRDFEPGRS